MPAAPKTESGGMLAIAARPRFGVFSGGEMGSSAMNRAMNSLLVGAAAILVAACSQSPAPPDEIVAAERAFAAEGYASGIKRSFLAFSAPDAVIFGPEPVNAHDSLNASPDEDLSEPRARLVWWPLYAGIANSGDLGFTTGPYAIDEDRRGHYFTIWKKQPDGAWKWVLDAGVGADASHEADQGAAASYLPASRQKSASPEKALSEVSALESAIAGAARRNLKSAYEPHLDDDSRLHSKGPPPAKTSGDRTAAFDARPETLDFSPLGGGASMAGDLVWSYGEGRFTEAGEQRTGYYVRVWQKRRAGWRLVFDEYLPPPPHPGQ